MFARTEDDALAALAPITVALATGAQVAALSPYETARRMLWETRAIKVWGAG